MNYFLVGSFGNGVVTVFTAVVAVAFAAVVVVALESGSAGIGVVTVFGAVVAGNVVRGNAAFF